MVEVYQGYLALGSEQVRVEFQAPKDASVQEKDAAFMAALAQIATIDYIAVGDLGDLMPDRNLWREALDAVYLEVIGDPKYIGGRTELQIRSGLVAENILRSYPDQLIDAETYDADEVFGESLVWMDRHFEFPNWRNRPLGEFLAQYGEGCNDDKTVIAYAIKAPNKDGVCLAYLAMGELAAATPTESGWKLPSGIEICFHRMPV